VQNVTIERKDSTMNIRTRAAEPRRFVLPLVFIVVAGLIAAGLTVKPSTTSTAKNSVASFETSTVPVDGRATVTRESKPTAAKMDEAVAPDDSDVGEGAASAEAQSAGLGVPNMDAKVIQTGNLTLSVKRNGLDSRMDRVGEIAQALGGYVVDMQVADNSGGPASGTVTLRIPGNRFGAAMHQLGDLGKVQNRQVSSSDVTEEYVDTKSRLHHDRSIEARLLVLLDRATTINQVLTIQDRLDTVQEQIEVEKGRIGYLDKMTAYSTIRLTVSERSKAAVHHGDGITWGIGDAAKTSVERFAANVGSALVWFGGALPALLILGGTALIGRRLIRRWATNSVSTDGTAER
jgi:hypothetical protein